MLGWSRKALVGSFSRIVRTGGLTGLLVVATVGNFASSHEEIEVQSPWSAVQRIEQYQLLFCVIASIAYYSPDNHIVLLFNMGIVITVVRSGPGEVNAQTLSIALQVPGNRHHYPGRP